MSKGIIIYKKDSFQERIAKKRFRSKIKRKDKNYRNNDKDQIVQNGVKITYHNSPIKFQQAIEYFCTINNVHQWKTQPSVIKFDASFSLFNDPERVLKSLLILLKHAKTLIINPKLVFKGHVSFGALYLIDNLCWEIGKKRKWVINSASLPKEDKQILSNLKSVISSNYEDENEYLINEKVRINRGEDAKANQRYKVKASEITKMVESAMREVMGPSYELSFDIQQGINSTIGEQFDNIHRHTVETEFGTICGFYNKKTKEVTILIFNFGKTIYDTFMDPENEIPDNIINLFNDIFRNYPKVNEGTTNKVFDSIVTLCSIQEGISSKLFNDSTRGYGFVDFIDNVFKISNDTQIAILSGSTSIKIDKTYQFKYSTVLGRNRRIIAFNEKNNIFEPPDPDFVKQLSVYFPGVIIETKIPIILSDENC